MSQKAHSGLFLLQSYDSDSDNDSGYRSEDERKRKHSSINYCRESKNKKLKSDKEEQMVVEEGKAFNDSSHSFTEQKKQVQTDANPHHTRSNLCQRKDMLTKIIDDNSSSERSIPLPQELLATVSDVSASSSHQGRVRSFPHERGNWASFIYIPLSNGTCDDASMTSLQAALAATCADSGVDLSPAEDFHVSLSTTFVLRIDWIEPFVRELRRKLVNVKKFASRLDGVDVFCNEERTRTFVALKVGYGRGEMRAISRIATELLRNYNLNVSYELSSDLAVPEEAGAYRTYLGDEDSNVLLQNLLVVLYSLRRSRANICDDYCCHVSLAWCLGDRLLEIQVLLPLLNNICNEYFHVQSEMMAFDVSQVHVKTGNRIHKLLLSSS